MAKRKAAPLDHAAAMALLATRLTADEMDNAIAALEPRPARYAVRDCLTPALQLQVHPSGAKSWCYFFRDKLTAKLTKATLGRHPAMDTVAARAEAGQIREAVRKGANPVADAKASQRAALAAREAAEREAKREQDGSDRVSGLLDLWEADCRRRGNRDGTLREVARRRFGAVARSPT